MTVATQTVGIYVFDEVEVLDFAAPFEVFSTAARMHERDLPGAPPRFEVALIADERRTVRARAGFPTGPRWIGEGPIVTSAGISAGIDVSLHLVERLAGEPLAVRTARQMDYEWRRAA